MDAPDLVLWGLQVLLAGVFLAVGILKLFRYEAARAQMPWVKDLPRSVVMVIGLAEIMGAAGLVLPMLTGIVPALTVLAAAGLVLMMTFASAFHMTRQEWRAMVGPGILLALAATIAWMRAPLLP